MRLPGPTGRPPKHPGGGFPRRPPPLPLLGVRAPLTARTVIRPGNADAFAEQLVVAATSSGWPAPGVSPFQLGRRLAAAKDATMKPVIGSVLHYSPDERGWIAQLADESGNTWPAPVIGWACVVRWTGYESEDPKERQEQPDQYEAALEPVVFDEGTARTPLHFRDGVSLLRLHMPGYGGLLAGPAPAETE